METNQENNAVTNHIIHDIGIARQVGSYSDAIEVNSGFKWLYTSGAIGMTTNGNLPDNIVEQSLLAWENTIKLLEAANMTVGDIVKVSQYLTRTEDIAEYSKTRKSFLGDLRPASTLLITPQMGWPGCLVEIEIIAAKKV